MQAPLRSLKGDLSLEDAEREIFSDEAFLIELSKISALKKVKLEACYGEASRGEEDVFDSTTSDGLEDDETW